MTTSAYRVVEVEDAGDAASSCENCGWQGAASLTLDVEECSLTPGDSSPVGRCPECDGLVYLDKPLREQAPHLNAEDDVITLSLKVRIRVSPGASITDFIENLDYTVTSQTVGIAVQDTEIVDAN